MEIYYQARIPQWFGECRVSMSLRNERSEVQKKKKNPMGKHMHELKTKQNMYV